MHEKSECLIISQAFLRSKGLVQIFLPFMGGETGVSIRNLQAVNEIHVQILLN